MKSRVNICGTLISNVSIDETISLFNEAINSGFKQRVCVTPVNCLVWASQNNSLKNIYNTSDLTLCDGVPLLWAARFLNSPLKGRVTGLDLFPRYVKECYDKGFSFFLLGAKDGVGEALREQFEKDFPGIKITGVYSPPFAESFSDEENEKIIAMVNKHPTNVLWVSLTAPKQDYWIANHLHKLNINIAIGVGGAFEVTAGMIQRAPKWMQDYGLEWLFRLINEPKRMYKRYLIEAPKILPMIIKQKFFNKLN